MSALDRLLAATSYTLDQLTALQWAASELRAREDARLWSKIKIVESGCWEWQAARDDEGYGVASTGGINGRAVRRAHRVTYELLAGPIPDGLEIDHLCRNVSCVNPDHLEPVSKEVNQARRPVITHCKRGHAFTADNTKDYQNPTTGQVSRFCRACCRAREQARGPRLRPRVEREHGLPAGSLG